VSEEDGMADMRATERLFELLAERPDDGEARAILGELRRRGDTLVRSHDLRAVLDAWPVGVSGDEDTAEALARLRSKVGSAMT
jgi:hypothetical protein